MSGCKLDNDDLLEGSSITGDGDHEECPEIKATGLIRFKKETWQELRDLYHHFANLEWAVYLTGTITNGIIYVDDFYIPEQEVNGAHVTVTEKYLPDGLVPKIVGHLHSHNKMQAGHSSEDRANMAWPCHIVLGSNGYVASSRRQASCGRWIRSSAQIEVEGPKINRDLGKIKTEQTRLYNARDRRTYAERDKKETPGINMVNFMDGRAGIRNLADDEEGFNRWLTSRM